MQKFQSEELPSDFIDQQLTTKSTEKPSTIEHEFSLQFDQSDLSSQEKASKSLYGNLLILFENSRFLITIGPDWACFLVGYTMFVFLHGFLISIVSASFQQWYFSAINLLVVALHNFSYLAVALSNPGIETKQTLPTDEDMFEESEESQEGPSRKYVKRYCKKCCIRMQIGTSHCRHCGVCVRKYDHHCPWVSKCIGQNNLRKFYVFVGMTSFILTYALVVVLASMAKGAFEGNSSATGHQSQNPSSH